MARAYARSTRRKICHSVARQVATGRNSCGGLPHEAGRPAGGARGAPEGGASRFPLQIFNYPSVQPRGRYDKIPIMEGG